MHRKEQFWNVDKLIHSALDYKYKGSSFTTVYSKFLNFFKRSMLFYLCTCFCMCNLARFSIITKKSILSDIFKEYLHSSEWDEVLVFVSCQFLIIVCLFRVFSIFTQISNFSCFFRRDFPTVIKKEFTKVESKSFYIGVTLAFILILLMSICLFVVQIQIIEYYVSSTGISSILSRQTGYYKYVNLLQKTLDVLKLCKSIVNIWNFF